MTEKRDTNYSVITPIILDIMVNAGKLTTKLLCICVS